MRNRQRGAYSFLFLVVLIAGGLLVFALAADGARLYAQQRVLQQQADAAALAAAQGTQACGGRGISQNVPCVLAQEAAAAAGFDGTLSCGDIESGLLETGPDQISRFRATPFASGNGVSVTLRRTSPRSLILPGRLGGSVELTASSVAVKELVATFSTGGSTAVVGSSTGEASLLGDLLGTILLGPGNSFALNPTNLESLAAATVTVGDLLNELGVNSIAALLPLSGQDLALALEAVAGLTGPVAEVLDAVIASPGIDTLQIADVLNIVGETEVPAGSEFPIYDLLMSLALNVAEGVLFNFPQTRISIPGVSTELGLFIAGAPSVVIGPARKGHDGEWVTRLEAPDVRLALSNTINLPTLPLLVGSLQLGSIDIPLIIDTGTGTASFVAAECASGFSNDVRMTLEARSSVALVGTGSVGAGGVTDISPVNVQIGRLQLLPFVLGGITIDPVLGVSTGLNVSIPAAQDELTFEAVLVADPGEKTQGRGYAVTKVIPGGAIGLDLSLQPPPALTLLGGPSISLEPITDTVTGALNPVISQVVSLVATPLLGFLGVELGGFSATLVDVRQDVTRLVRNVERVD